MFFQSKDQWYAITTKFQDPDEGFRHLDSFFKSVTALMSNQLWSLVEKSLKDFESFFAQFSDADSELPVFSISLTTSGAQIRFSPPLPDLDAMIISILEELVLAVKDIPRVETKLFSSLQGENFTLPCISIQDDRIADGKFFKKIIARNTISPQKHLLNYDKYKSLMTHKAEKRIDDFLREKHELEDYETVIFIYKIHF